MMVATKDGPAASTETPPVAIPSYRTPRFRRTPYLTGLLLVLASGITFGTLPIFVRYAYADGATPVTVLVLRFALAGALLLALTLLQRRTLPTPRRLLGLIALGGLGYGGQSFCYFTALTLAPVSLVTMLLYTFPAMVVGLSVAMRIERVDLRRSAALVLALGGIALTVGLGGGGRPIGVLYGLLAAVIYSVYIVMGFRLMASGDPVPALAVLMLSAAAVYGVIAALSGYQGPASVLGWSAVLGMVVIATVVPSLTFFLGMRRVGPAVTATMSTIEPLTSVLLAVGLLGEPLGLGQMVGGALILVAAVLLGRGQAARAP